MPAGARLHAKTAVADGELAFVTSANNLTCHALDQNLEVGVLICGGSAPRRPIHRHVPRHGRLAECPRMSLIRRVTIDFANAEKRNTNIQGLVAVLDADGGNYRMIARFNEIDVSSRKTQTFLARGRTVLYVMNTNDVGTR